MNKLCCIGLSLAARIIGTYTMSLSILMINVIMSDFFSRDNDEDFFNAIQTWALVGLNWTQVLRNSQLQRKAQTAMVCFLVYTLMFLLASAYLALGSISRKPKCAVPWMYLQMISIIDQSVALSVRLTHQPTQYDAYDKSVWYIPVSSVYLLVSAYFWMVVQAARRDWSTGPQNCQDLGNRPMSIPTITSPANETSNNSEPKSPSFLSQNLSTLMSPRPPILPK